MSRPTMKAAVEWIALNDNPGLLEPEAAVADYLTTLLVADLFDTSPATVARSVLKVRCRILQAEALSRRIIK
jgi:hypothetical protein